MGLPLHIEIKQKLNVIVGKYEELDEVKAAFEKIHIEFSQNTN